MKLNRFDISSISNNNMSNCTALGQHTLNNKCNHSKMNIQWSVLYVLLYAQEVCHSKIYSLHMTLGHTVCMRHTYRVSQNEKLTFLAELALVALDAGADPVLAVAVPATIRLLKRNEIVSTYELCWSFLCTYVCVPPIGPVSDRVNIASNYWTITSEKKITYIYTFDKNYFLIEFNGIFMYIYLFDSKALLK